MLRDIRDLGVIEGDLVLFGGPYSNAQALEALLAEASGAEMICTGDLVAYCADPVAVAERVRAAGIHVVRGNCEDSLAAGAPDCGCGFEDGSACSLLSVGWYGYADRLVGAALRRWMAGLPRWITFAHAGRRWAVIHGGAREVNRFLWETDADTVLEGEIAVLEAEIGEIGGVIAGHSGRAFCRELAGRAFSRELGGKIWLNAGVIGMPPHDGRSETEYAVLGADGAISLRRLSYDYAAAAAAMERAGLRQGYETSLRTGYWPSEDVLPAELRRAG